MVNNTLNRYLFENLSVRGELVQLDQTYQQIIASHDYPTPVQTLLGELLVATTLLTATLKFEGSITLQLQGDGPVSLAVINSNHQQKVRGVARWQGTVPEKESISQLMGNGHLVITIEPQKGEKYQGIVALEGDSLASIIEHYFKRSEQLKTRIWIRTGTINQQMHAAGMLLQIIPDGTGSPDDFEHLEALTETVTDEELLSLEANTLLYRLYHQETVKVFDPQPVTFCCNCSRERSGAAITSLPQDEIQDILAKEGEIALHCEYCNSTYRFDAGEVAKLFKDSANNKVETGRKSLH
jgi:molecular chaperone Hsp33